LATRHRRRTRRDPSVVVVAKPAGGPLAGRARLRPVFARLRGRRAEIPAVRLHEPDGHECRSAASSGPSPEAHRFPDRGERRHVRSIQEVRLTPNRCCGHLITTPEWRLDRGEQCSRVFRQLAPSRTFCSRHDPPPSRQQLAHSRHRSVRIGQLRACATSSRSVAYIAKQRRNGMRSAEIVIKGETGTGEHAVNKKHLCGLAGIRIEARLSRIPRRAGSADSTSHASGRQG